MSKDARRRLLIADDDETVRSALVEYFQEQGFEVLEAGNGLETLLQVKRGRPDAVVLDLMMPRLGGLDALKRIRPFDPWITVIVVTGVTDRRLTEQALTLGARGVLTKPIQPADLLAILEGRDVGRQAAAHDQEGHEARPAPVPGRVLVVDDDAEFRSMIEELLAEHGLAVRSAATAPAAFWAVSQEVPDVILLDINMPGLSGIDIMPAIHFVSRGVKIIIVTGTIDPTKSQRALGYGAFDVITKPAEPAHLLRTIEAALAARRLDLPSQDSSA